MCETWGEHEFGGARVLAVGTHPVRGTYQRVVRVCGRCGKRSEETRWTAADNAHIASVTSFYTSTASQG